MRLKIHCAGRRAISVATLALATFAAGAQTPYPTKPTRVVIGFPAGQASEQSARLFLQKMSQALGQTFYLDNKAGASGTIAAAFVAGAPPDGYTLLWSSIGPIGIAPALYKSLPYNTLTDLVPVAQAIRSPVYLAVNAGLGVDDVPGFIAYSNAHKGRVNYGSAGNGSIQHLSMELFRSEADVELTHVPYKGSPAAMQDLAAGTVQAAFDTSSTALALAKGGRIKLIGVSSRVRTQQAPDIPTIAEQGLPNFEVSAWSGLFAPKGTPPEIVEKLNAAVNRAMADPGLKSFIEAAGGQLVPGSVADFKAFVARELPRWNEAARRSGAQID